MAWWIEPRHAEASSPKHPNVWEQEEKEGPRLYFDGKKVDRVRRDMNIGDLVFLYETAGNPDHPDWIGASAVGGLVRVKSSLFQLHDVHRNARTGRAEDWKVSTEWVIRLVNWTNGILLDRLRRVLGFKDGWSPITLRQITQRQYDDLRVALEECARAEASLRS